MKTLNITFTDAEFRKLKKAKRIFEKKRNNHRYAWRSYLISSLTKGVSEK